MIKTYQDWLSESSLSVLTTANSHDTPPNVLAELARSLEYTVRYWVAANPSTPTEALYLLANDDLWSVRERVAANPSTPTEALYLLARDKDEDVRKNALINLRPRQDQEMQSWGWDEEAIDLIRQLGI